MLREYLYSVRGFSRRTLAAVKHKGGKLLINGKEVTVRYMLQRNDVVEVIFPPETRSEFMKPQPISFPIIFEDDDVLVVNKPPFMATIPSSITRIKRLLMLYYIIMMNKNCLIQYMSLQD